MPWQQMTMERGLEGKGKRSPPCCARTNLSARQARDVFFASLYAPLSETRTGTSRRNGHIRSEQGGLLRKRRGANFGTFLRYETEPSFPIPCWNMAPARCV